MVAGDHDDRDAGAAARLERRPNIGAGRVLQPQQAQQQEPGLRVVGVGGNVARRERPLRDRDDPEATGGHRRHRVRGPRGRLAALQDGVRCALDEHPPVDHDGHATAPRVEGETGLVPIGAAELVGGHAEPPREHVEGRLHRIAVRLPQAVDRVHVPVGAPDRHLGRADDLGPSVGWADDDVGDRPVPRLGDLGDGIRRPRLHHRHLVAGEGAGLVGADDGRGPQRLDGLEVAHQHRAPCHLLGTPGEGERHGRQERLGDERDGHADREDESLGRLPAQQQGEAEEHRPHRHRDHGDQPDDASQFTGQGRHRLRRLRRQSRDLGQPGRLARRIDVDVDLPLDHERPGEHRVPRAERHGLALARQHRRVDLERGRHTHDAVSGDPVSGTEDQSVAHHHVGGVHLLLPPVAQHGDERRQQGGEPLGRPVGTALLDEREHGVEHDDGDDRHAQLRDPGHRGQHRRDPEHDREEVRELVEEAADGRPPPRPRQEVRAIDAQALCRLRRRQSRHGPTGLHASSPPRGSVRR